MPNPHLSDKLMCLLLNLSGSIIKSDPTFVSGVLRLILPSKPNSLETLILLSLEAKKPPVCM